MKTKRLLACFLTLAMLITLIPGYAAAEEPPANPSLLRDEVTEISSDTKENTNQAGGIIYTKTSTAKSDGTIDITLTAHTTGVVRQLASVTPTDIVLVLDVSGSMNDPYDSFSVTTYEEVFGERYNYWVILTGYGFNDYSSYYINTGTTENPVYTRVSRTGRDDNGYEYFVYTRGNTSVYVYPALENGTATNRSEDYPVYQFYSLETETTTRSRIEVLKNAVNAFIETTATMNAGLETDEMHTISIVKFADDSYYDSSVPTIREGNHKGAGGRSDYNYSEVVKGLTPVNDDGTNQDGESKLKDAVNSLTPGGATAVDYGLNLAEAVLMNRSMAADESAVDRNEVVIVFTDGEPNHSSGFDENVANSAIATAGNMESTAGVTIYGVCIDSDADATDLDENINKFMHYMSSNYPTATSMRSDEDDCDTSAGYYMTPDDSTTLTMIFESIIQNIDHPTITMGEEATMVDTISPYFDFQGTVDDVKLQTSRRNADGTWADPVDDDYLEANITGDRLTVDGFDFDANYVSETGRGENGDFYGKRLVVSFTIVPDYDVIDIASATLMDGILPTNSGFAALVDSDSAPAAEVETPALSTYQITYMVDGDEYTSYNRFAGSDVEVDAEPTKLGYTFSGWSIDGEEVDPGDIFTMPDEDVEIEGTFTANTYNVSYQYSTTPPTTGALSLLPTATTAQYGDTVNVADQLELQGYVFVGWYPLQTDVKITEGTFTMPAKDVTLVGYFESSTTTPYKVEHYLETLTDGVYETDPEETESFSGTTGHTVTATPLNRFTGFTYNETASADTIQDEIKADGSLVLKVFYDRNEYSVTYGYDGDTQIDDLPELPNSGTYKYGEEVSVADKAAPPEGYTFTGWYRGTVDNPVEGTFEMPAYNVNLLGYFTANTSTEYKVEHYLMDTDGTYPDDPADTETFRGTTGNTVTATPLVKYTGFTYDDEESSLTKSGAIEGDGSLVLKLFYSRNKYTVKYVYEGTAPDEAPEVPEEKEYYHGETVTIAAVPAVDGYNFEGWTASVSGLEINDDELEMPKSNVEFRGRFVPGPTTYTVEHYTETLTGGYELYVSNEHNGVTGRKATYTPLTITGFDFDSDNDNNVVDEVIKGDGSTVIKLHYNRNRYNIAYEYDGTQPDGAPDIPDSYNRSSVMYGETVSVEDIMVYEGYEFDGWYPSIQGIVDNGKFVMPAADVLFSGRFFAEDDTAYTVEHYTQTLDGGYELYETQSRHGTTDQPALYTPLTIDGFYFDIDNENNVLDEPVAGDGSTVLELYYNRNLHKITYEYIGEPPEGAPELPTGKDDVMYGAEEEVADVLTFKGYTFDGWFASVSGLEIDDGVFEMPDSDVVFRGRFVPGPTTYTVEHYLANEDNTGYETDPYDTQEFSGTTGETITAAPIVVEGFTYDDDASSATKTGVIAGNGSTVLKLYYSRNSYNVTYGYEGDLSDVDEPTLPEGGTYTYGTTVTVEPGVTAPEGYTFIGWYMGTNDNIVTSFDMPARDVELLGYFIPNSGVPYSIHHYLETLTDGEYETDPELIESFSGTTGHTVTATPLNRFTGFKYNEDKSAATISGEIEGDGSLVLEVYYDREQYTVTYGYDGDIPEGAPELPEGGTYKYGEEVEVAAKATAPEGYTFIGWYRGTENNPVSETFEMPNFNVHILGNFEENTNTPYRVEHYLQTEDCTGYELDGEGETRHGTTGMEVSALPKEYPGFTYNSDESITSGTIAGNGTLVLEFYYDRNLHSVTYQYEGITPEGTPEAPDAINNVPFGSEIIVEDTPEVPGYTFVGWYIDEETNEVASFDMPDKDVVLKGKFSSNLVDYTVNYWLQNIDAGNAFDEADYTLDSSYTEEAFVGQHIEATAKAYTGFSLNTSESTTFGHATVNRVGNGNLVLNLYYDRHMYDVTYGYYGEQPQDAPDLSANNKTNVRFGTELDVEEKPTLDGYAFDGWYTRTATVENGEFTMPDHDVAFLGRFITQYSVSYDLNGGTGAEGVDYSTKIVDPGTEITINKAPTRSGYTFKGWKLANNTFDPGDTVTVDRDIIFVAQWSRNDGGGTTKRYTLTYETNGGSTIAKETYNSGTIVKVTKVPVKDGYVFEGWYEDKELTKYVDEVKMTKNITVYAKWVEDNGGAGSGHDTPESLNGDDHFAYVVGYPDGTVRPNDNISRAEVTAIFFRLLKPDELREKNLTDENDFVDVNTADWYNTAISTMAKLGIVKGRTSEDFVPNAFITRAEFATICVRFDDSEFEVVDNFTDVAGHWAEDEIHEAAAHGWIRGYEDGTFKPDQFITRAEAMTMINRVLNRIPETEDDLLPDMIIWPDNSDKSAWYYIAVQEATNSHDYVMKNHIYEKWTALREVTDWTKYE